MKEYGLKEPSYMGGAGRSLAMAMPVLALAAVAGAAVYLWTTSTLPTVTVAGGFPRALGPTTPMRVQWTNPNGARRITVFVDQAGVRTVAYDSRESATRFAFRRPTAPPGLRELAIAGNGLSAGKAIISVEVESNDLRGQVARIAKELPVVLEKPSVRAGLEPVFVRRGSTAVVRFTPGGGWETAGVRLGRYTFPSWPVAGRPGERFSLFTVPPDAESGLRPELFARNALGDEATALFPVKVTEVKFRDRTLELGDKLMEKVLGELDAGSQGEAAERFARINSVLRRQNDAAIAKYSARSEGRRLWDGAFTMLPRGKAEALFADHRTYRYAGKALNREWHLGIDMASVRHASVPAANAGTVVHAGPLGIYGKCVVIDHGLSVLTVYGHMNSISVKPGEAVGKGQPIGESGMTGLAGGDHLHLGLMVGGAFVDPVDWVHSQWIDALQNAID